MNTLPAIWRALKRLGLHALWAVFSLPALAQTTTPPFFEGFENAPRLGEITGAFTLDTTPRAAHSGNTGLKVTGSTAQQYLALSPVSVNPYGAYRLSVWVQSDLSSSADAISVNALQGDASSNAVGWYRNTFKLIKTGGRQKWTQYSAVLSDMNPRTTFLKFYLRVDAGVSGTVWFDDISLTSINLLPDAGFESALWPDNGGGGATRSTTTRHSGNHAGQLVAGSVQRYIASAKLPISNPETYDLSLWISTAGFTGPSDVVVNVLQFDQNDQPIGWYRLNGDNRLIKVGASGSQTWVRRSVRLSGFAPNTAKLQIYLRTEAGRSGTAWIDDVVLAQAYNDDFIWGINDQGATSNHLVYPWSQLGTRLDKGAMLGAQLYRVNLSPKHNRTTNQYAWEELDNVVEQAFQRRMKVYLVLFADGQTDIGDPGSVAYYQSVARSVAQRYKGKIAYYQLGNELDNPCIIPGRGGEYAGDYDPITYARYRTWLQAVATGLREGDPDARRAINITWTHTGFLELLNRDAVPWEVTGLDWYWALGAPSSQEPHTMSHVLDRLDSFPQQDILITESNIDHGTMISTEAQQADYLERAANEAYYRVNPLSGASTKLKGFLAYELLDRPRPLDNTDDHVAENQRHYGLVRYQAPPDGRTPGTIGAHKPAYERLRQLIQRKR